MVSAKEILQKQKNNNVNNVSYNYNNNVNNVTNKQEHRKIEDIANRLVEKFNAPNSYKLFCLVAYKNPEQLIWRLVGEIKEKPAIRNQAGYFITMIKIHGEL